MMLTALLTVTVLSTVWVPPRDEARGGFRREAVQGRGGGGESVPLDPILLALSLLPPDSECSGTPPDGVTFTRASAATCIRSNRTAVALTSNQARVHSTLGLLVEGTATNAVLHSRDVTAAAWTGTGCSKTATGMDGVSLVGRCTGPTTVLQTLAVATGARTASVYVRRQSGTCNVQLKADAETTSKALIGGWERLVLTYTSDDSVTLGVAVNSGCVADIDYVQDEAGSIATSPIVTAGTAAVRAAEIAWSPLPDGLRTHEGCSQIDMAPLWSGSWPNTADSRVYGLGGQNNRLGYVSNAFTAYAGPGNGVPQTATTLERGVSRVYRTEWSLSAGTYRIFGVTDGTSSPNALFIGFGSEPTHVDIGGTGLTGNARAFAHLRNLVLGRTPEACQ